MEQSRQGPYLKTNGVVVTYPFLGLGHLARWIRVEGLLTDGIDGLVVSCCHGGCDIWYLGVVVRIKRCGMDDIL
jgi:hypothetical protein